ARLAHHLLALLIEGDLHHREVGLLEKVVTHVSVVSFSATHCWRGGSMPPTERPYSTGLRDWIQMRPWPWKGQTRPSPLRNDAIQPPPLLPTLYVRFESHATRCPVSITR